MRRPLETVYWTATVPSPPCPCPAIQTGQQHIVGGAEVRDCAVGGVLPLVHLEDATTLHKPSTNARGWRKYRIFSESAPCYRHSAAPVACLRRMRGRGTPCPSLFPLQQLPLPLQHSRAPQNHQHGTQIVEDGVHLRVTAFMRRLVRDYRLHMP